MGAKMKIESNSDAIILICAFRYALGRMTYVVEMVVDFIIENWDSLYKSDKDLIVREIQHEKERSNLGHDCDVKQWNRILTLYVNENLDEKLS